MARLFYTTKSCNLLQPQLPPLLQLNSLRAEQRLESDSIEERFIKSLFGYHDQDASYLHWIHRSSMNKIDSGFRTSSL